jgi:integrase
VTNPKFKKRGIVTAKELDAMFNKADKIKDDYFRLRVKALIALVKKFGKRRREISTLEMEDLQIKEGYLYITFTIVKKHKLGLFQYFKYLKREIKEGKIAPHVLDNTSYFEHVENWKMWKETELGQRVKKERRTKRVSVSDKYARMIIEFYDYVKDTYPEAKFLFSSGVSVFGEGYMLFPESHLSGRHLLRLIKPLNKTVWLHLLRETKGAEIAKEYGNNLAGVYAVKETLDLERMDTAYAYVNRYAIQELKAETD